MSSISTHFTMRVSVIVVIPEAGDSYYGKYDIYVHNSKTGEILAAEVSKTGELIILEDKITREKANELFTKLKRENKIEGIL